METAPLITLAQIVVGFLSVPVVSAVLTAVLRYVMPSSRLAARLQRDLLIYKDLPSSPQKDVFEAHINRTLGELNARLAPELRFRRVEYARRTLTVLVGLAAVVLGVLLVVLGFIQSAEDSATLFFISVVGGALATGSALVASRRSASAASKAVRVATDAKASRPAE